MTDRDRVLVAMSGGVDSAVAAGMPGLQGYVRRGSEEWFGVAGVASVESKRPMTLDDRIRLASVTKMMTYAAVMEIVKRGSLSLSDAAGCGDDLLLRGTAETQQALRGALTSMSGQSAELDVADAIARAFELIGNAVCRITLVNGLRISH